ncbi:ribonuclease HII [Evansella sp. LMS18]|uniref:ribonuclease HII n=1 Tax=Evansella sp. LMS18 TaxID=2924033 RepID=UPI0020D0556F|nr:ribonuclease HII [Evansella sp. LMS18]UTR10884.1 ribonuclease HII [Evansella sp. LMS18]
MVDKLSIKDIKAALQQITEPNDPILEQIKADDRKGVQQLYTSWTKQYSKKQELHNNFYEMRKNEESLWNKGYKLVGGIDEVGRGPLAGPVIASCVVLSPDFYLPGLTDSKKLSKQKREEFFQQIKDQALCIGIGTADAGEIDKLNIYEATKLAMERAVADTGSAIDYLLIDAMKLSNGIPQTSIIKGDATSISIAASSVVAKVTRDRYMEAAGKSYPGYGFENNMGYGTEEHLTGIRELGITKEHRKSFAPVREVI